jgi:hypothetical protein
MPMIPSKLGYYAPLLSETPFCTCCDALHTQQVTANSREPCKSVSGRPWRSRCAVSRPQQFGAETASQTRFSEGRNSISTSLSGGLLGRACKMQEDREIWLLTKHYNPYLVLLSMCISLLGAHTTTQSCPALETADGIDSSARPTRQAE